ncbi:MAG: hypothetical protein ABUL62_23375 [Myxococcales bacterium]
MFSQITKRSAATPRLLLGATLGAGAWVAVCVSCFVDLGSLPSTLKTPAASSPAPCTCPSKQAQPDNADAERAPGGSSAVTRAPLPCRT